MFQNPEMKVQFFNILFGNGIAGGTHLYWVTLHRYLYTKQRYTDVIYTFIFYTYYKTYELQQTYDLALVILICIK